MISPDAERKPRVVEPRCYTIGGDPIALARARHGNRRVWDCQKQLKIVSGLDLRKQHEGLELYEGPLFLSVTFYMAIPEKTSEKRKQLLQERSHIYKPDLSNLIKFIEDVATGVLYHDDCTIAKISGRKIYDRYPRTEFYIIEIG